MTPGSDASVLRSISDVAPGGTPTRTGCEPATGKAIAIATDMTIGKEERPEERLRLTHELAQPGERELDERMMRSAARAVTRHAGAVRSAT